MEDKELQAQIQAAKDAGYSDAEIQAHIDEISGKAKPLEEPEKNKHHEANVGTAQAAALGGAEKIGEIGKKIVEYGLPAAGVGYGLYKGGQAMANRMPGPVAPSAPAAPATGFTGGANPAVDEILSRPHPQGGSVPTQPGQVAAETPKPLSPEAQAWQQQQAARAAQATQPPTAGNFMSRMAQLARTYAPMARGATGVGLMTYSPNLGPQVPSAGPARGSEINPQTGRPWTQFELDRYNQQYS
jgi:hypothetical protein